MKRRGHYTLLLIALCGLTVNGNIGFGMGLVQETKRSPAPGATGGLSARVLHDAPQGPHWQQAASGTRSGDTEAARETSFTIEAATISGGGGVLPDGSVVVIGQSLVGTMSNANYTLEVGIVPALTSCITTGVCDDGQACTVDTCDPGNTEAETDGCVHQYVQRLFGDVVQPFAFETLAPQPDLGDLLCVLQAVEAGGAWEGVCPLAQLVSSVNEDECDTSVDADPPIDLNDVLAELDAFGQEFRCADPCP